jgi:hypothetical protein
MENTLNDARREEIWLALSDVFVDTEVNYGYIARRITDIDLHQLEEIFFTEVAPYCGPNLMTAIPEVWDCFYPDDLISGIQGKLKKCQNSILARLRYKGFVLFCRWYFRDIWKELVGELAERKRNANLKE